MPRTCLRTFFLVVLLALACGAGPDVFAQETNPTTSTSDQNAQNSEPSAQNSQNIEQGGTATQEQPANSAGNGTAKSADMPLPSFSYKDTKESVVGRSLVLSIGFFPFTYFYTGFAVDIARFAAHGFSASYAPWPFKTQYSVALTDSEMWIKLGIASLSSLAFGFLATLIK